MRSWEGARPGHNDCPVQPQFVKHSKTHTVRSFGFLSI